MTGMTAETFKSKFLRRPIAMPGDHGSWVFLLSPMLIGFFVGGEWNRAAVSLTAAALAGFLLRQPAAVTVKAYAGRRSKADLPAARLWVTIYGLIGGAALVDLLRLGYGFLAFLAVPGLLVFSWHLWLVSRREERHKIGVDVIASGTLALAAPATYWVSVGTYAPITGWWLWGSTWLQSAASIVYAFLRLEQRQLKEEPDGTAKLAMGGRALLYSGFNTLFTLGLGVMGALPRWIWIPYALQLVETVWGTFNPAMGVKPTRIGLRQLAVSTLFTIAFILAWK